MISSDSMKNNIKLSNNTLTIQEGFLLQFFTFHSINSSIKHLSNSTEKYALKCLFSVPKIITNFISKGVNLSTPNAKQSLCNLCIDMFTKISFKLFCSRIYTVAFILPIFVTSAEKVEILGAP